VLSLPRYAEVRVKRGGEKVSLVDVAFNVEEKEKGEKHEMGH
jgi:hypothetical protein